MPIAPSRPSGDGYAGSGFSLLSSNPYPGTTTEPAVAEGCCKSSLSRWPTVAVSSAECRCEEPLCADVHCSS